MCFRQTGRANRGYSFTHFPGGAFAGSGCRLRLRKALQRSRLMHVRHVPQSQVVSYSVPAGPRWLQIVCRECPVACAISESVNPCDLIQRKRSTSDAVRSRLPLVRGTVQTI